MNRRQRRLRRMVREAIRKRRPRGMGWCVPLPDTLSGWEVFGTVMLRAFSEGQLIIPAPPNYTSPYRHPRGPLCWVVQD